MGPTGTSTDRARLADRRNLAIRIVGKGTPAGVRIATAPDEFVHHLSAGDIARSCALLDPLPTVAKIEVALTAAGKGNRWNIDVAARDRPRLLHSITGGLADTGFDLESAVVATWLDGIALDTFVGANAAPPEPAAVSAAIAARLARTMAAQAIPDAKVSFGTGSTSTPCEFRAADRRGLLACITAAFSHAGAEIQSARISTVDGQAVNRFTLSTSRGQPLDQTMQNRAVKAALVGGVGQQS